jgi:hypothetical protein
MEAGPFLRHTSRALARPEMATPVHGLEVAIRVRGRLEMEASQVFNRLGRPIHKLGLLLSRNHRLVLLQLRSLDPLHNLVLLTRAAVVPVAVRGRAAVRDRAVRSPAAEGAVRSRVRREQLRRALRHIGESNWREV